MQPVKIELYMDENSDMRMSATGTYHDVVCVLATALGYAVRETATDKEKALRNVCARLREVVRDPLSEEKND
jgi:hypothetical protein